MGSHVIVSSRPFPPSFGSKKWSTPGSRDHPRRRSYATKSNLEQAFRAEPFRSLEGQGGVTLGAVAGGGHGRFSRGDRVLPHSDVFLEKAYTYGSVFAGIPVELGAVERRTRRTAIGVDREVEVRLRGRSTAPYHTGIGSYPDNRPHARARGPRATQQAPRPGSAAGRDSPHPAPRPEAPRDQPASYPQKSRPVPEIAHDPADPSVRLEAAFHSG